MEKRVTAESQTTPVTESKKRWKEGAGVSTPALGPGLAPEPVKASLDVPDILTSGSMDADRRRQESEEPPSREAARSGTLDSYRVVLSCHFANNTTARERR